MSQKSKAENLRADVQENMPLPIGEHITIFNSQNKRVEGKIAGYEHNHFILVRVQGFIGRELEISTGEKINAHFIRNEFTVAFVSTMAGKFGYDQYMFVACQYPQRFVTSTKRIGSRVDCLLPVTVKSDDRLALGVITNVSFKGCQIAFDNQTGRSLRGLIMGQNVSIFLNPFQTNAPGREVQCVVRYISRGHDGIKFGVSFDNVGMSAMSTISEYIKGQQTREVLAALKNDVDEMKSGTGKGDAPGESGTALDEGTMSINDGDELSAPPEPAGADALLDAGRGA